MADSGIEDVQQIKGKKVGVQSGSTTEDELKDSTLMPDITIVKYGDNKELMQELEEGKIDVAFIDSISTYYYSSMTDERLSILPTVFSREELAIGFRNSDHALRDRIQEVIYEMNEDGTVKRISEKWFGKDITIIK